MNRRNFLKNAAFSSAPMFLNSIPLGVFANHRMLEAFSCNPTERALVIIHLEGANDGLNNLIPLNQMQQYSDYRPNIKFAEGDLLTLDTSLPSEQQIGVNPNMSDFKHLFDNDQLAIIQGAGYPNHNRSHFASGKLIAFGGDGGTYKSNNRGFIANYLDNRFPIYEGIPFADMADPLGISMGSFERSYYCSDTIYHTSLKGIDVNGFGSAVNALLGNPIEQVPNTDQGTALNHILAIENTLNFYSERVSQTYNSGANMSTSYNDESLANQLKIVARLISGGSKTKVFTAGKGGWDTHSDQLLRQNSLLKVTGEALRAFQEDLNALGIADKVITVVFSEFGRKYIENGNGGTDHGSLGPMYVVGNGVKTGVYGFNPLLDEATLANQAPNPNTQLQFDYRTIFGTILQDWMGADDDAITATLKSLSFIENKPALILPNLVADSNCQIIPDDGTAITLKAFLEGPFETNKMSTQLSTDGIISATDPYGGNQTAFDGMTDLTGDEAVVDWVQIELRDASNPATLIASKAALLQSNGTIIDASGGSKVYFPNTDRGDYYVAIRHYNHLGVMTAAPITFDNSSSFDFSNPNSTCYSSGGPTQRNIGGIMCLWAGDSNGDGTINAVDKNNHWKKELVADYSYGTTTSDFNLDGVINNTDKDQFWRANNSKRQQF